MDAATKEALATCLGTILRDEPWQDFGFPKRPTSGALFQRFRAQWKVELEKTILQQMLNALTAAYALSGRFPADFVKQAAALYTSSPAVTKALGFKSRTEGAQLLEEGIQAYVSAGPDQWPQLLYAHVRPDAIPDKSLSSRLFLGCATFAGTAKNMIVFLKSQNV